MLRLGVSKAAAFRGITKSALKCASMKAIPQGAAMRSIAPAQRASVLMVASQNRRGYHNHTDAGRSEGFGKSSPLAQSSASGLLIAAAAAGVVAVGYAWFFGEESPYADDTKLQEALLATLQALQAGQHTEVEKTAASLVAWLKKAKPSDYQPYTRLIAAQFLVIHAIIESEVAVFERDEAKAKACYFNRPVLMKLAWGLLDGLVYEDEEIVGLTRLEVAQRWEQYDKLNEVFDSIMARSDKLTEEELGALLVTAPLLGRWADMRKIGSRFDPQQLEALLEASHVRSIEAGVPDVSTLYAFAESLSKDPPNPPGQIKTQMLESKDFAVKSLRATHSDPVQAEKYSKDFMEKTGDEWMSMPGSFFIQQRGHAIQVPSMFSPQQSLTGYITDNRIEASNTLELQAPKEGKESKTATVVERLVMTRDPSSDEWIGTFTALDEIRTPDAAGKPQVVKREHVCQVRASFKAVEDSR